jgi:hypothetical protein
MKVKVYVIDLEIPPRVKKWAFRIGTPLVALFVGGVAFAGLPGGYADGQPLTKAILDNNFNYLQSEITTLQGQTHPASGFRAYLSNASTTLSAPSGANTPLVFDKVVFDSNSEYDHASGTFSPQQAGAYWIGCSIGNSDNATNINLETIIMVNGAFAAYSVSGTSTAGVGASPDTTMIAQLAAHDSVECFSWQNSGAPHALETTPTSYFAAARIY